jgi:hypothetical protein
MLSLEILNWVGGSQREIQEKKAPVRGQDSDCINGSHKGIGKNDL